MFSFHPEAEEELSAAIEYYEERETGLGYDFSAEVFKAIYNVITPFEPLKIRSKWL